MPGSVTDVGELARLYRAFLKTAETDRRQRSLGAPPAGPGGSLATPPARQRSWFDYSYLTFPIFAPLIASLRNTFIETVAGYLVAAFFIVAFIAVVRRPVRGWLFPLRSASESAEASRRRDEFVMTGLRESARPESLSRAAAALKADVANRKRKSEILGALTTGATAIVAWWLFQTSTPQPEWWHYLSLVFPAVLGIVTYQTKRVDNETAHFIYCLEEAAKIKKLPEPAPWFAEPMEAPIKITGGRRRKGGP